MDAGDTVVRCRCCHRVERRGPGGVTVELEGGRRRPERPEFEAARLLAAIRHDGERLVGPCPRCAMPMSAPGAGPSARWDFGGGLVFDGGFVSDGEPTTDARALALVGQRHPAPTESVTARGMQVGMLIAMAFPVLFWAFMFGFWINYAVNLASAPWRL